MRFSTITLFLPLLLAGAIATPAPVNEEAVAEAPQAEAILTKRGFGCPNDYKCNRHCRSLKGGRTGGYCKYQIVCTCVFG